jgi:hypothetical protein
MMGLEFSATVIENPQNGGACSFYMNYFCTDTSGGWYFKRY